MLVRALLLAASVGLGIGAPAWPYSALAADGGRNGAVPALASWYGLDHQGLLTASGERFDRNKLTAAHPSLPMGTVLRITNPANGRQVLVRINDRGPFLRGRMLDLSETAARRLGMLARGLAWVLIEIAE
jgi:rare lipoprotein A